MTTTQLTADSYFSREVYKLIRPHIAYSDWPDAVEATFVPAADGMSLIATFHGFASSDATRAARLVGQAGLQLAGVSPARPAVAAVLAARRWRDALLYAFVPLLFAIPVAGAVSAELMPPAGGLFALAALGLVVAQLALIRCRARLSAARFQAELPVPGMRLKVMAEAASRG